MMATIEADQEADQMVAAKIKQTDIGALYELTCAMEFGFREGDRRDETHYVVIEHPNGFPDQTIVWPAEEDGALIDEGISPAWYLRRVADEVILRDIGYEIMRINGGDDE